MCVQGEEGAEESLERKLGDNFIQLLAALNLCDVPEEPKAKYAVDAWNVLRLERFVISKHSLLRVQAGRRGGRRGCD
jgi:hypothetical protein